MARFAASMAVLVVTMFAIAAVEASIYRTTVTTTEIEDDMDNQQSHRCQRQMRGMRMNMCQQYLRQSSQRGDDIMIEQEGNPTRQGLQDCCREMRGVSEECRCEAVRQMVQQMQGQAYQGQMMQKARQLPSMCGMRPQYCDIRGRYVEY
ncbi:hypothetical protein C5167_010308 [Papaver somniferum]|uniref:Bifunctional inhibitor/plant lipid transfer protein/seed storage helical domain-containing protein n=1 Tax=Papaver somniferum TaxID=3469 RepID=A0A4Y7K199_PAPSO|nr:2S albumin-like [Papaver somniferum]RZC66626.1 hypothetical protein C5167_010308 [Papaver somniferum]